MKISLKLVKLYFIRTSQRPRSCDEYNAFKDVAYFQGTSQYD